MQYVPLYLQFIAAMSDMSDASIGAVVRALGVYASTGEAPKNLKPDEKVLYTIMAKRYDRDKDSYLKKCERLKANSQKRWQKTEDTEESNCMQMHSNANNCIQLNATKLNQTKPNQTKQNQPYSNTRRRVPAQEYEQRQYTVSNDLPDWMKQKLDEIKDGGNG